MATKTFAYNKEPHTAKLGESDDAVVLKFHPEMDAGEFLDAIQGVREIQNQIGDGDPENLSIDASRDLAEKMKTFLSSLMLPDSRDEFTNLPIPLHVLQGLCEFATELYGQRPTTSSNGSPQQRRPVGSNSTAR